MKKVFSFMLVTLMGLSIASAQGMMTDQQSSIEATETSYFDEMIDASFQTESIMYFSTLSDEERSEKIDMFLTQNRKYLPKKKMEYIRETLMGLNESRLKSVLMTADAEFKDPTMLLVVSFFLGGLGVDRFILGEAGWGVLKLITVGGFGVWYLIDLFIIMNKTRNYNYNELMELCGKY